MKTASIFIVFFARKKTFKKYLKIFKKSVDILFVGCYTMKSSDAKNGTKYIEK